MEALTEDFIDWSSAVNLIMNKGAELPKNITGPDHVNASDMDIIDAIMEKLREG